MMEVAVAPEAAGWENLPVLPRAKDRFTQYLVKPEHVYEGHPQYMSLFLSYAEAIIRAQELAESTGTPFVVCRVVEQARYEPVS